MLSGLIGWIIFGGIVGAIAKWIMPGKDPGGIVFTILLGIAGSMAGGLLLGRWGGGWIGSIAGALLLLWLYKKFIVKDSIEVCFSIGPYMARPAPFERAGLRSSVHYTSTGTITPSPAGHTRSHSAGHPNPFLQPHATARPPHGPFSALRRIESPAPVRSRAAWQPSPGPDR
jgi:uncharacterized membrane protein YeaQ/YmgE (transglycosylase-associated protein family)